MISVRAIAYYSIVLLLSMCTFARADSNRVMLVSSQNDATGKPVATSKQALALVDFLEKQTNSRLTLQSYPWKRALDMAKQGQGFLYGASQTPERLQYLLFSEPIFTDYAWLVTRCDARFSYRELNDLKGKTLGIVRDTSYGAAFDEQMNKLFKVENDQNNSRSRFLKLYLRRMDALLIYGPSTDVAHLQSRINQLYGAATEGIRNDQQAQPFCILPHPVSANTIHIAVAPGYDDALLGKINQALRHARSNGTLQRLFRNDAIN